MANAMLQQNDDDTSWSLPHSKDLDSKAAINNPIEEFRRDIRQGTTVGATTTAKRLLSSSSSSTTTTATIPQRKSVDFATLPPPTPKRVRHMLSSTFLSPNSPKWNAKQVVDAISTSISPNERLEAIQQARHSFHHDDQFMHNNEMASGADAALTKHMTYLLYHYCNNPKRNTMDYEVTQISDQFVLQNNRRDKDDQIRIELSLTCDAIESLYRATSDVVGVSFRRLGKDLLHLLITILNHELNIREQLVCNKQFPESHTDNNDGGVGQGETPLTPRLHEEERYIIDEEQYESTLTDEGDLLLRKGTKILGHFARVGEATEPMAHFPGLLPCLIKAISLRPYDLVPWETRLSALWIVANLACCAENMSMMASTTGLIQGLIDIANRPLTANDSLEMIMENLRSRAIACRAILNLSWVPDNKLLFAENTSLIDLLTLLCLLRSVPNDIGLVRNSTTIQNILDTTRQHALGALRNIAAAPRLVKIALCQYRNGHILDVLTDAAWNDHDTHVKDRALATIHNLAVHDTAATLVQHPALVLALKDVLLSSSIENTDNSDQRRIGDNTQNEHFPGDGTPRQHAAATLLVLERTITPDMDCYENLRYLLDAINNAPSQTASTATLGSNASVGSNRSNSHITAV